MSVERLLDAVIESLPAITDAVIYASVALAGGVVYAVAFFGIVSSFYRDSHPLVPPTRALGAAMVLLAPLAVVMLGLGAVAEYAQLPFMFHYSPARLAAWLCGTPLLLWLPAVALTRHPPFRNMHMPEPPLLAAPPASAAADAAAGGSSGLAGTSVGKGGMGAMEVKGQATASAAAAGEQLQAGLLPGTDSKKEA